MRDYTELNKMVEAGKAKIVKQLVEAAIAEGTDPEEILELGLLPGMSVIGEKFTRNEVYVPEVLIAARAMKAGMELLKPYLFIRERLRPYIRQLMREASETGAPVMRPLFYDFQQDENCWNVEDSYMFGPDLLISPVMEAGADSRRIYLPAGCRWVDAYTGETYEGGQQVTVPAPLGIIPVMMREGCDYPIYEKDN